MKTQRDVKLVVISLAAIGIGAIVLSAGGGSLEPNAPPGPTGRSLEEIYNAVQSLQPQPQTTGFYAYLYIDGIPGESTAAAHQGWIKIDSWSWGETNAGSLSLPSMKDIVIVHGIDKASPKLAEACCIGAVIQNVTLHICRPTPEQEIYLQYVLKNVMVSSVNGQTQPTTAGDVLPLEEVSLNYQKIEWIYTPADGNTVSASWDVVCGAPVCPD
jgi:type VI secretion system secreted protein Hcp